MNVIETVNKQVGRGNFVQTSCNSSQLKNTLYSSATSPTIKRAPNNKEKKIEAKSRTSVFIDDFFLQNNRLPTKREMEAGAHCSYKTAKPYWDRKKRELELKEKEKRYLYLYSIHNGEFRIPNNELHTNKYKKIVGKVFTSTETQKLSNAYNVLNNMYSCEVNRITLTIPGNTDVGYLAITQNSNKILEMILNKLYELIPDTPKNYLWCWELQDRGSPHLHIDIYIPNTLVQLFTETKLRSLWVEVLDEIYLDTGIDVYLTKDDYSHKDNKNNVHVDIRKSKSNYLAKPTSKNPRTIFNGILASPEKWCGVSRSLSSVMSNYTKHNTFVVPVHSMDEAKKVVEQIKSEIPIQVNWEIHASKFEKLGYKTTLESKQVASVRKYLKQKSKELQTYYELKANEAPYSVIFELHPNNFLKLRWGAKKQSSVPKSKKSKRR